MPELAEAALPDLAGAESGVSDGAESVSPDVSTSGADGAGDTGSAETAGEVSQGSEGAAEAQQQEEAAGDGRRMPSELRNHLASLKDQNPALAKQLKNLFFERLAFRNHFPGGPQEALKLKEFVETVGGEDGWKGVQDQLSAFSNLDELFSNGQPEFIDRIAASDPESFSAIMPRALEKFAELGKESYDHLMARVVVNTLGNSPLGKAYQALAADEKTKALAQELAQWYNGVDDLASKVPQKKVDPERQKFEKEKQEWETKRQDEFRGKVGQEMQQFYVQNLENSLSAEFKARNRNLAQLKKSNPDAYWDLMNSAYGRIKQPLTSDKAFVQKFESLIQQGDGEGAKKLAQSRAQRLIADAAKKTYNAWAVASGATTANAKTQTATNQQRTEGQAGSGPVKLPKSQVEGNIDWNRTQPSMVADGKAYLKGRKELVTF